MSAAAQIEEWLGRKWKTSKKGAIWQNIGEFNVSVWEKHDTNGAWGWRIVHPNCKEEYSKEEYSKEEYGSEEQAKRAVLNALSVVLGFH